MGTRGHFGFYIRGRRRGSFNHWDSHPDRLGKNIINFILSLTPEDYATMARLVAGITWIPMKSAPSPELQERYESLGFADAKSCRGGLDDWYGLLYKTQGAAALPAIQSGQLKHMAETAFKGGDWEWAYFIDFENRLLETWAYEKFLTVVSFEELVKDGVEGYLTQVNEIVSD